MTAPADVVAAVRTTRPRTFICRRCGSAGETLRQTGRLPQICETCEPRTGAWQRERTERQLRAALIALDDELATLRAAAGGPAGEIVPGGLDFYRRAQRPGEPGPGALTRALRGLQRATGRRGTREALLDLAAVAWAWSRLLETGHDDPGSGTNQGATT